MPKAIRYTSAAAGRVRVALAVVGLAIACVPADGAEASFGLSSPATVSFFTGHAAGGGVRESARVAPAFRANLYPTLKLGSHWFAYGAIQTHSEPYFYEELADGYRHRRVEAALLQAYVGYRRVSDGRAFTFRAGHLTTAFGSFPLRYDDARNWLIDLPQGYGYYYVPVSVYGMPGAEIDVTLGKIDARVQLTAGSPSNPRGWLASDRYANWTAGGGVTVRQGFRVGASAVYGPYLHRRHRFFFRGEASPKSLPATGYGVDVQWARGKWNVNAEMMRFQYPYRAIPYFYQTIGYGEVKWSLHPRWYLAARAGHRWRTAGAPRDQTYEGVLAYRPAPGHLVKVGYLLNVGLLPSSPAPDRIFGIQYVVSINPPAIAAW